MANILDYLDWRGDLTLAQSPLNEVDNLYVAVGAGVLFVAVGAYALYREWRAYKFGLDNIDDPTTWSDEEEDDQLEALMGATKAAAEAETDAVEKESEEGEEEQA